MFKNFNNDPFFENMHDATQEMNDSLNNLFGGRTNEWGRQPGRNNQLFPFDNFAFQNVFKNAENMANSQNPDYHVYSSSKVVNYSKRGNDPPKYYEATQSTLKASGGIKETRKSYRDSERGVEKMAIGHHLDNKGYRVEKRKNLATGHIDENREFINLDERDFPRFESEWKRRVNQSSVSKVRKSLMPPDTQSRLKMLCGPKKGNKK